MVPSIRCITIINAEADGSAKSQFRNWNITTSLEELHILSCKIYSFCLRRILRLPKALKQLTIMEASSLGLPDPNEYIDSMLSQYKTFESLILIQAKRKQK
jgi:hypothetical protein